MAESDVTTAANPLDVHIVTPEREVWAGDATFVLARSANGDLGVLAGHEPTLAILGAGPLRIETVSDGTQEWGVEGGFLSVGASGNRTRVDVLAEFVTDDPNQVIARSGALKPDADASLGAPPTTP